VQGARIKKRAQTEGSKGEFDAPPVPVHGWKIVVHIVLVRDRCPERPLATSLQAGLTPICPDPATASPNFFPCVVAAFLARQQVRLSPSYT
jgi:hypothetical protein